VERERGGRLEHSGDVGGPCDGAWSETPECVARAYDGRGTFGWVGRLPFSVWPVPDTPPKQQSEQAVLRRTGQELIDQGLTVAQGEQRATRQKLGPEAARRLEPDQAEPCVVSDRDADGLVTSAQRTFLAVR
jgi:hypothetical protein